MQRKDGVYFLRTARGIAMASRFSVCLSVCQSRTRFLNPGIRDWRISNPGIPAGLWDPGNMISKTIIIEYMGLYCYICVVCHSVTGLRI